MPGVDKMPRNYLLAIKKPSAFGRGLSLRNERK
jgi:hypothetical protein